jgi:hypothetical protein
MLIISSKRRRRAIWLLAVVALVFVFGLSGWLMALTAVIDSGSSLERPD